MSELILSVNNPNNWRNGWTLGDINGKKPKEICRLIQFGMKKSIFFKTFSYERIMVELPNGNILIIKDKNGKVSLRKKRRR